MVDDAFIHAGNRICRNPAILFQSFLLPFEHCLHAASVTKICAGVVCKRIFDAGKRKTAHASGQSFLPF
jgi:hypothetical protein